MNTTLHTQLGLPPDLPLQSDVIEITDDTEKINYIPRTEQEFLAIHRQLPCQFITMIGCALYEEYVKFDYFVYPSSWFEFIPDGLIVITIKQRRIHFNNKQAASMNRKESHLPIGFRRYNDVLAWELNDDEINKFNLTADIASIVKQYSDTDIEETILSTKIKINQSDKIKYHYSATGQLHMKLFLLMKAVSRSKFVQIFNNQEEAQDSLEDIYFQLKKITESFGEGNYNTELIISWNSLIYFSYMLSNCISDMFLLNDYIPFADDDKEGIKHLIKLIAKCELIKS